MNQQNEGAAPASPLTAEQFAREILPRGELHDYIFAEAGLEMTANYVRKRIFEFAEAYAHEVRQEADKAGYEAGFNDAHETIATVIAERDALDLLAKERLKSVEQARAERDALTLELKRMEDAWMQDETIGITNGQDDGTLRPSVRKTVERAERAESALREAREAAQYLFETHDLPWHEASCNCRICYLRRLALKAEDVPPQEGKA